MTYHDVEKNHGVEHICDIPNFKPIKPYIHVHIIKDLEYLNSSEITYQ